MIFLIPILGVNFETTCYHCHDPEKPVRWCDKYCQECWEAYCSETWWGKLKNWPQKRYFSGLSRYLLKINAPQAWRYYMKRKTPKGFGNSQINKKSSDRKKSSSKTLRLGQICKRVYEIHGRGVFVYVPMRPLVYLREGSSQLSDSDTILLSKYNPQKEFIVSFPVSGRSSFSDPFLTGVLPVSSKKWRVLGTVESILSKIQVF